MSEVFEDKRHLLFSIGLFSLLLVFLMMLSDSLDFDVKETGGGQLGSKARPFSVKIIQNGGVLSLRTPSSLQLNDLKGKPLVLNFWATWCMSCREEVLERFWLEYRDAGVNVLGIAVQDTQMNVSEFIDYYGRTYLIGLDESGEVLIDYGVTGVPETFLIDKDGIVRDKILGPLDYDKLEQAFLSMHARSMGNNS